MSSASMRSALSLVAALLISCAKETTPLPSAFSSIGDPPAGPAPLTLAAAQLLSDGTAPGGPDALYGAAAKPLTLDQVLLWRDKYRDLLDKPKEAAIEKFGPADVVEEDFIIGRLTWNGSAKTEGRRIAVLLTSTASKLYIAEVELFAAPGETLDAMELLKKAPLFMFETGTYGDPPENFLAAETRDGRARFLFDVGEAGVAFRAVVFARAAAKH